MIGEHLTSMGDNVIESASLVRELGLTSVDFADPAKVMRAKEIMEYLSTVPEKDAFIRRSGVARSDDKLGRLWEYTQLHKEKDAHNKKLKDLAEMIERYER